MMLKLRHPISLLLICLLVMIGVLRSYSSPSPVGADAPDVVFSAFRAEAILRGLLPENTPHVSGSPYNTVVRNRVVSHLESSGYEPQIQSVFHCNPMFGSCSPLENIIAVKPGSDGKLAVLLTAHYDSGWAGPGAADDGAGTSAILEIARMLAEFPPFRNDIIFLFSDSEENGLIGADAFAEHNPIFEKVKAVFSYCCNPWADTTDSQVLPVGSSFLQTADRPVSQRLAFAARCPLPPAPVQREIQREGTTGGQVKRIR